MKTITISSRFWKESFIEKFPAKFSPLDLVQIKTEIYSLHSSRHRFHICKLIINRDDDWESVVRISYPGELIYFDEGKNKKTSFRIRQHYFYGEHNLDLSFIREDSRIIIKRASLSQLFSFNLLASKKG